ncbi:MAG: hypothetical protein CVV34_05385 [Methanomicrobiales archaeon HGW-Methanomicrobiales-5]|nr:MAG: hypothetical protein CVV34_05385 [Methanomicrobiales archaeon HGW-Methanomicrobiales-5]
MKTPTLYIGAIAVFCTLALIVGSAGAAVVSGPDSSNFGNKIAHGGPVKMLDRFEEQGYNVSAIRAAAESGDNATVHTLMQQFMEAHKDLNPARNATEKNAPGLGTGMMDNRLTQLEAKGYDVSSIRAAIESGDNATVHTLMQQFMEAHKDELPRPGVGRNQTLSRGLATK